MLDRCRYLSYPTSSMSSSHSGHFLLSEPSEAPEELRKRTRAGEEAELVSLPNGDSWSRMKFDFLSFWKVTSGIGSRS